MKISCSNRRSWNLMPSYAIHLAVAEEYLKKSNCSKENHEKFIKGVIYPDMVKDKSLSHYGSNSSVSDLSKFLSRILILGQNQFIMIMIY